MYKKLKVSVQRNPIKRAFEFWVFDDTFKDARGIATTIEFEQLDEPIYYEPLFHLYPEEAQNLMDELWNAGVRPSDIGTAGHLEAVKYHLEDMRKLVFERK